jgi:hypothetical protein
MPELMSMYSLREQLIRSQLHFSPPCRVGVMAWHPPCWTWPGHCARSFFRHSRHDCLACHFALTGCLSPCNSALNSYFALVRIVRTFGQIVCPLGEGSMVRFARLAGLALIAVAVAAPVAAKDMLFTVTNKSGVDLVELYASSTEASGWEENILAGQVLPSGSSGEVTISDAGETCAFKVRMVFSDGDILEDQTDLCTSSGYTIN